MSDLFNVIYQTSHGDTIEVDNPRLEAYKHAAYLKLDYSRVKVIKNADMSYTVKELSGKIASMTFESSKTPQSEQEKKSKRREIKSQREVKERSKRNAGW